MRSLMSVLVPFPSLRPDTLRTLIVAGDDGEAAVTLRDALPREMVVVLDARPAEVEDAVRACRPYPWALVWDGRTAVPPALARLRRPTILLVRDGVPARPAAALAWRRLGELTRTLERMLSQSVGGMRLAPGTGVELPGGAVARTASLQALISMHPLGVAAPPGQFRAAAALLRARGLRWAPAMGGAGTVVLMPQGGTE